MPKTTNPPVCCTLPEPELRTRRAEVDAGLAQKVVEVRELDTGYGLRFSATPGLLEELARFVDIERGCCAFLDFNLRVEKDGGPIWLDLTGTAEAKSFLRPLVERWTS